MGGRRGWEWWGLMKSDIKVGWLTYDTQTLYPVYTSVKSVSE